MIEGLQEPVTLRWYADVLRERRKVVLAAAVVGLALAASYLTFVGEQVVARTIVRVDVIDASAFDSNEAASRLIDSATEAQLASSFDVASRAEEVLGDGTTAREIRDNTLVVPVEGATVMNVTYTADSEEAARRGADAVARSYLEYRSDEAQSRIEEYTDAIDTERAELRVELAEAAAEMISYEPNSPLFLQAEADRAVALQSLSALTTQQYQLERVDTTAGAIISPAAENHVQYTPSRRLVLAAGLFGGLLVGLALAFVRNATASRVSTERQLRSLLGARNLGSLRRGGKATGGFDSRDARAVRARSLAELPVAADTLVAVDVTSTSRASLAPFAVAASLAELGNAVSVVVVGAPANEHEQLVDAFQLRVARIGGGHDVQLASYRALSTANMCVSFVAGHGDAAAFERELEAARSVSTDDATVPVFTVVVVSGRADEDSRIVAFSAAESVVVFATLGTTHRSDIEWVLDLARRGRCRVVGAVTVPRVGITRRDATSL